MKTKYYFDHSDNTWKKEKLKKLASKLGEAAVREGSEEVLQAKHSWKKTPKKKKHYPLGRKHK